MGPANPDDAGSAGKSWIWKVGLIACGLGVGTWLLLVTRVPLTRPEDLPKPPDLHSESTALRTLLNDADARARSHPNSAEDVGRLGMAYHANQYYEQAEIAYRIALRLTPDDYRWCYCLALVAEEGGREMEAHDLLLQTVKLKADYFPALQMLADIYYKRDRLNDAARYYERSARAGGKYSELQSQFGMGRIAARRNDWSRVIEVVAPLSRDYPHVRPPHQLLLDAYEATGQSEKAAQEREDLLEPTLIVIPLLKDPLGDELLDLSCSSTRLLKEAGLFSRFRRPDDAIRAARRAVEVAPEDPDAHHLLARTLLEAHGASPEAVGEALANLESGLRLRPDDLLPLWYFATIFFKENKADAAVEQLRTLLAGNARSAESHYYLGLVADHQGRIQEAFGEYREALRSDPENAEAYHKLGLVMVKVGRLGEAITYFRRAVQLKPTFDMARCNLGVALDLQGKTGQAVEQFELALRLKPNDATTHKYLAIALTKSGNLDGAIEHYREALRFSPGDAEAHYGLGCVLVRRHRDTEAAEELREALRLRPDYAEARAQLQALEQNRP